MGQKNSEELSEKVTFNDGYRNMSEMTVRMAEECLDEEFSNFKDEDEKAGEKACYSNSDLKPTGTWGNDDFQPGESPNFAGLADLWRLKPAKAVAGVPEVEDESEKSRKEREITENDENFDEPIKCNKTNVYTWNDEFLTAALAEEFAKEDEERKQNDSGDISSEALMKLLNIPHQDLKQGEELEKIDENDEIIDEEAEQDDLSDRLSGISSQGSKENEEKLKSLDAWEIALNKENLAEDLSEATLEDANESGSSSSDEEFHNWPSLIPQKMKINVLEGIDPKEWERNLLESGCKVYFIVKIQEPDDKLTEFSFSCLWEPETPIIILFELALRHQNIDGNDLKANEICLKHFSIDMPVECWIWMDARPESTYEMRLKRRT
ncbi:unnamed protein product [Bursaphelenchus xylophilus]|uniref:(pine wood nematode) hypothetical protein n=1 Tax=Bursaphelenchus xylophilus TaxID=6326 RepID=A0A1I7S1T4_BURXY|nr:unnamed protein product [Bursaphelenchus xylophilus]CAG9089925.1 unnamed protein product [Bursaphelenchus xylophilus]